MSQPPARRGGRAPDEPRPITVTPDYVRSATGSVLYESGGTRVICVASIVPGVPSWLPDGEGWLTAEYSLLPYSTRPRKARERTEGKVDGRTQEIQRLIGRALRASIDRRRLPRTTIQIDCDVLEADGGTRTASICGAGLALGLAVRKAVEDGRLQEDPRVAAVLGVSAGLVDGEALLDLDYPEDHRAEVDLNVVGTAAGDLVEVQGASESTPCSREQWQLLTDLAILGLTRLDAQLRPWQVAIGDV